MDEKEETNINDLLDEDDRKRRRQEFEAGRMKQYALMCPESCDGHFVIDDVKNMAATMADEDPGEGERWIVQFCYMTEEEKKNLPEFDGW